MDFRFTVYFSNLNGIGFINHYDFGAIWKNNIFLRKCLPTRLSRTDKLIECAVAWKWWSPVIHCVSHVDLIFLMHVLRAYPYCAAHSLDRRLHSQMRTTFTRTHSQRIRSAFVGRHGTHALCFSRCRCRRKSYTERVQNVLCMRPMGTRF